jgi:hypothetical protein
MRIEKIESTAKFVKGALVMHDLKAEYVGTNIIHTGFHVQVAKGTLIFFLNFFCNTVCFVYRRTFRKA